MNKLSAAVSISTIAALALSGCANRDGMIPQGASPVAQTGGVPVSPASCGKVSPSEIPAGANADTGTLSSRIFTRLNDDGSIVPYMPTVDDAGRVRSLQFSAKATKQLTYMCGAIQPEQKIYVVYWGSEWKNGGDPNKIATVLERFLGGLHGSQWEAGMGQYYGPVGTHIGNDTTLVGTYVDTAHSVPAHPSDGQVAAEAKVAAAHFGDYSIDASYVIAMPHAHNPTAFDNGQYCAYHNSLTAATGTIQYTDFPYIPDAGKGCGAGSVTKPGTDDGVSIVIGHEQAETSTDPTVNPNPTGWYNKTYGEIGDECAWAGLRNTKFATGTFPTQPLWSNKANACVQ